jgi:lactoylglutathione lyase
MAHVCIGVQDLDKSVAFYRDVLGMQETGRRTLPNGTTLVMMNSGGKTEIELVHRGRQDGGAPGALQVGLRHIAYLVSDIDAAVAALRQKGVEFYREPGPKRPGLRVAFFRDPDGADIELMQE